MRDFSKRIRKAFKRLCDPFKRTLNGYKRIFPLNGKALVSVFAFQVTYLHVIPQISILQDNQSNLIVMLNCASFSFYDFFQL